MRIYNYLFYKSFVLAKKSKNFDDFPVLGGLIWTIFCLTLNIGAVLLFIDGLGIKMDFDILKYRWVFAFGLEGLLLFYYCYKGRYKKIIKYYEDKKERSISIHPIIVIAFYYICSVGLIFLAGLFKNKDWIFAQ
jgi:hypothetical protein